MGLPRAKQVGLETAKKTKIKLLEFGQEPSSVVQLWNWALCKPSFEPKSINSQKK